MSGRSGSKNNLTATPQLKKKKSLKVEPRRRGGQIPRKRIGPFLLWVNIFKAGGRQRGPEPKEGKARKSLFGEG